MASNRSLTASDPPRRRPDPDLAYHYQPLRDSVMMGWLERTLLQNQIYFSSPASFNDPFDSKVSPSFDGTPEQKRAHIESLARLKYGPDATDDAKKMIEEALADPKFHERSYETFRDTEINTLGIYCLSEKHDDILMWSHYADSHRGVCLILASSAMFPDLAIEPIIYPEDNTYPNVNFFTATLQEQSDAVLLTKAKHWDYEHEWRIVDTKGPGWHDIDPSWLRGLIFGCLASPAQIAEIRGMSSKRHVPLTLFQAKKRYREFALDICPVT